MGLGTIPRRLCITGEGIWVIDGCSLSIADPFYWAWLPMARKPFSDRIRDLLLDKLRDDSFVTSIVEDLRVLFAVRCCGHARGIF